MNLALSARPDLPFIFVSGTLGEEAAIDALKVGATDYVLKTRLSRLADGPERAAAVIAEAGIDAVNLHYTDWNGGLVALFHRFERIAFGWDLQYDHVLHPAVRMGLDGVYSDHVDVMMQVLSAEYVPQAELDYRRGLT